MVVLAMRRFETSEEVQTWGCSCLGLMALHSPDTALAIHQLGGLEVAANAISRFASNVSVQRFGCNFLYTVFSCLRSQNHANRQGQSPVLSEEERTAIYDRFVRDMDGVRILKRSMRKCHRVVRVLAPCCGIFSLLAEAGHKAILKEEGVVTAVAVVLETHSADSELNRYASSFMVSMFSA